jgi:hypothetical protein
MAVYTVHQPPIRADASPDPTRFVFVRDGFHFWAFLLVPLWMAWHRMWLVLIGYVVIAVGLESLVRVLGGSASAATLIGLLISMLVGLEAGTLRRFTLARRRWRNIGVISGHGREDAERRFYDGFVGNTAAVDASLPPSAPVAPTAPMSAAPDVIGLFPQPGTQR